jgi:formylglycine-generating enzyme
MKNPLLTLGFLLVGLSQCGRHQVSSPAGDAGGRGGTGGVGSGGASVTGGTGATAMGGGTGGGGASAGAGSGGASFGGSGAESGEGGGGGSAGSDADGGTTGGLPGGSGGDPGAAGSTGGAGFGGGAGTSMGGSGGAASTERPNRCRDLAPICGPTGSSDCCASAVVPGGTYNRSNGAAQATVSDFSLDIYEITVGRYRAFLESSDNVPSPGSGKNPNDPTDAGWDPAWNEALSAQLERRFCVGTWTAEPGANEGAPVNCAGWYALFAFCIWDDGRLPTEAEWNYAAAGGADQRVYPWSNPPSSDVIDATYALYGGAYDDPVPTVGSRSPKGDARWGHADMAGSMFEFTRDLVGPYIVPCVDCAAFSPESATDAELRINRGGSRAHSDASARTHVRDFSPANIQSDLVGARCAR